MSSIPPDSGAQGSTASTVPSSPEIDVDGDHADGTAPTPEIRVAAVLVDDNPQDRLIAERLSDDGLVCRSVVPQGTLDALRTEILAMAVPGAANVVLLDYRLDDRRPDNRQPFSHRAGALAAELKEHRPQLPLVLLTTEANLRQWVEVNPAIGPLFDLTVLKSELDTQSSRRSYAAAIGDLAVGFQQLERMVAAAPLDWWNIAAGIGLDPTESAAFAADWPDAPPTCFSDLVIAVLKGLLAERPGPLLPTPDAAARLAIQPHALVDVLEAVPRLRYTGPFSLLRPRVWRARLDAAQAAHRAASIDGIQPEDAKFAAAMDSAEPQRCRVCDEQLSTQACALCRRGIDDRHYVVASELLRPAWSDSRTICFACIEDGTADDERFPSGSRRVIERLRAGESW